MVGTVWSICKKVTQTISKHSPFLDSTLNLYFLVFIETLVINP